MPRKLNAATFGPKTLHDNVLLNAHITSYPRHMSGPYCSIRRSTIAIGYFILCVYVQGGLQADKKTLTIHRS